MNSEGFDEAYSSRRLPGYVRRNPVASRINLIGGTALFILAGFTVLLNLSLGSSFIGKGKQLLERAASDFETLSGAAALETGLLMVSLLSGLIYLVFLIPVVFRASKLGIRVGINSFFEKFSDNDGEAIPDDFAEDVDVGQLIHDKTVFINESLDPLTQSVLGKNIRYLSPRAGRIAKPVIRRLKNVSGKVLRLVILLAVLFYGLVYGVTVLAEQNLFASIFNSSEITIEQIFSKTAIIQQTIFPIILIGTYVAASIATGSYFIREISPKGAPRSESKSIKDNMAAAMSPYMLVTRLPHALESLALPEFDNRVHTLDGERKSKSLSESGEFETQMFIERQPVPARHKLNSAGRAWLLFGWVETFFGFAVIAFFVLPAQVRKALTTDELLDVGSMLSPIGVALTLTIATMAFGRGLKKIREGHSLMNTHWFKSPALFVQLKGQITKDKVTAGSAVTDSLKSETSVIRSDFVVEVTTTELICEWDEAKGVRTVIAMQNTSESKAWLEHAITALKAFAAEGVTMTAIDLKGQATQDIALANLALTHAKSDPSSTQDPSHPLLGLSDEEFGGAVRLREDQDADEE